VRTKKKEILNRPKSSDLERTLGNPIRLKPSTSDYATFVKTTANAMGKSDPPLSAYKPNKYLLSLANLES